MQRDLTDYQDTAPGWERALMAFLAEKRRRSGSERTTQSYSRMLQDFFGRLGRPPDQVTPQEVFSWAHGRGLSGKEPSAVTIGARKGASFWWRRGRIELPVQRRAGLRYYRRFRRLGLVRRAVAGPASPDRADVS